MSAYFSTSLSSVGPGLDAIVKWGISGPRELDLEKRAAAGTARLDQPEFVAIGPMGARSRQGGCAERTVVLPIRAWRRERLATPCALGRPVRRCVAGIRRFASRVPGTSARAVASMTRATRPLRADLKTPGSRRRLVDAAGGDVQHHPVDIAGGANRDQALVNVPQNRLGIAIDRVTVAATAHEPDVLDISGFERDVAPGLGDPRLSPRSPRGSRATRPRCRCGR